MVLETIVFSSVLGYMGGAIISKGTSVTEVNGMKAIKIDFNEGYRECMRNKNFRFIRDMALVSGTAYLYSKASHNRITRMNEERKERKALYEDLCREYKANSDKLAEDRFEDYYAIAGFILDNPDMSERRAYENMPLTENYINLETFSEIYESAKTLQHKIGDNASTAIIDFMDVKANLDTVKLREANKDMFASQLLGGRRAVTEAAISNLRNGKEPMVFEWKPLQYPKITRF